MAPTEDALAVNRRVVEQFRAGGEVDGMHRDRLLLLTTRGRRTGQPRTTPMMFHVEPSVGDGATGPGAHVGAHVGARPVRVVIASGNGSPDDPAWVRNLVADPSVHVEVDGDDYDATARVAEGAEHDRIWADVTAAYPFFLEHAERAGRTIPLVVLEPVAAV